MTLFTLPCKQYCYAHFFIFLMDHHRLLALALDYLIAGGNERLTFNSSATILGQVAKPRLCKVCSFIFFFFSFFFFFLPFCVISLSFYLLP